MKTETIAEQNKKTVLAFYKEAHFDGDVDGAISRYVGDNYVQHTPASEDGAEGLRKYINAFLSNSPSQIQYSTVRGCVLPLARFNPSCPRVPKYEYKNNPGAWPIATHSMQVRNRIRVSP